MNTATESDTQTHTNNLLTTQMEIARQWLEVQRATPSFAGDATLLPANDALLRGPLPAGLGEQPIGATPGHRRGGATAYGGAASPSISGFHRHSVGSGVTPVHDQLLAKGRLYQQRREAMKERHVTEQLKHLRNPIVSEQARQLKREEKVFERFRRMQHQKEERAYFQQRQREIEDAATLQRAFKPTITARARQASARVGGPGSRVGDQLEAQLRRRDERAGQIRMKYMMHEMAEVREVPAINPVSERLAARRREKEGFAGLTQLEAMIERDRLRQAALWEKQREREIEETANPYPKITLFAANLQREGDAAERLYNESLETEARRVEKIQASLAKSRKQHSHTPRITTLAAAARTNRGGDGGAPDAGGAPPPIEDELMRRHLDAMAHREELIRQQLERERERRTPAINPVSDTIASRLPQTARERLAQPKAQFVDANEPRFAPRINPLSAAMRQTGAQGGAAGGAAAASTAADSGASMDAARNAWDEQQASRSAQYGQYEQRRSEKIRQLREEAEQRELAECTFHPQIHSNPVGGNVSGAAPEMQLDASVSLIERSNQWLKRREAKLQVQRQQRQQQADAASPGENAASSLSASRPLSAGPGTRRSTASTASDSSPQGIDSFVDRLEEGRRRRHEQYSKLYATGASWNGASTVPEQRPPPEAPPVRALRPPVTTHVSLSILSPPPRQQ